MPILKGAHLHIRRLLKEGTSAVKIKDPIRDFWLPGIIPGFKLRQGNQSDDAHTLKGNITLVLTP